MTSFFGILDAYIFTGVVGNAAYDLIKSSWLATTNVRWENLYIDAFRSALEEHKDALVKYAKDGNIYVDTDQIKKALYQDLEMPLDLGSLTALTDDQFANRLSKALHKREALVIGGHNLSESDYSSLVYRLVKLSIASFRDNILSNERAFREAILRESKSSQEAVRALEMLMTSRVNLLFDDLHSIQDDLIEIRKLLTLDRPKEVIKNEIEVSINKSGFILCDEYPHEVFADRYFIAQEFNNNLSDLRKCIDEAMTQLGVASIRADDFYWGGPILCKISSLILGTPFGVYQLSESQNRNVHLELGIAMGLGKPFVLVKDKTAEIADLIHGLEYYQINSYLETKYNLGDLLQKYITNIGSYCIHRPTELHPKNTAVIAHGYIEHVDIGVTIAKQLTKQNYTPVILGKFDRKLAKYLQLEGITPTFAQSRDEIITAIQMASLGVYRISKTAIPDTFVAAGLAIGMNRPFFLVVNEREDIPSDLEGLSHLRFHGFTDLEKSLEIMFPAWLKKVGLDT